MEDTSLGLWHDRGLVDLLVTESEEIKTKCHFFKSKTDALTFLKTIEEALGFGPLVGQKKHFEDFTLASGKLWWAFSKVWIRQSWNSSLVSVLKEILYVFTETYSPEHFVVSVFLSSFQATTTGPRSPRQSPAPCSQTWWTRFCSTRSLTRRSSANAQPRSARWTERTVPPRRRRTRRKGLRWSTAWPVSDATALHSTRLVIMHLRSITQGVFVFVCSIYSSTRQFIILFSGCKTAGPLFPPPPYQSFLQTNIVWISCSACKVSTKSQEVAKLCLRSIEAISSCWRDRLRPCLNPPHKGCPHMASSWSCPCCKTS